MIKEIHIEFTDFGKASIVIDGEELKNISSFMLEIKDGKATYSTNCEIFQEPKSVYEEMQSNTRIRTIQEAFYEIKEADPKTRISENSIRNNVKAGKIPSQKEGNVYLVDVLNVLEFYKNKHDIKIESVKKGITRPQNSIQKIYC